MSIESDKRRWKAQKVFEGILADGGHFKIEDNKLKVGPAVIVKRWAADIREYKRELIMIGRCCPECLNPLRSESDGTITIWDCPEGHLDFVERIKA